MENDEQFKSTVKRITQALNIDNDYTDKTIIPTLSEKFGNGQYKMLTDEPQIQALIDADKKIMDLHNKLSSETYFNDIEKNWKELLEKLSTLQTLILIKKLDEPKTTCAEIVSTIVDALNTKLTTVNTILETNIKISQKANEKVATAENIATATKQKYLKYKSKYLHLKNNM